MSPTDPTRDFDPATADGPVPDSGLDAGLAAAFGHEDAGATADFPGKDEHVGAVLGGKYKLIEAIGEGGMGSVYMAQQTEPVKRLVAVKVIKAGMDSKAVLARFEAERQALAMMDHPNIARVLDAGTTESGRPYFVMELVKGVPITEYCDTRKLTPRQRLELFVPVCHAIQHAHMKGVIHRDIKPSNVLVALYDDKPVPKVIDFGVAKAAGQSLTDKTLVTGFGAVVGTPEYMSPEQANLNNLDIDTRSDVYALGVLLYELLTGSTPVDRKSLGKAALLEILRIVREVEAPRPSAKLSTSDALPSISANRGTEPRKLTGLLRSELDWIVMKALEKDRTRRYETANGFAADVQRYLSGEPVQAHPPSTAYRVKKFVRRNKGPVVAATVVAAVLLLGIAGTTFGLIRAEQRRVEADQAREREAERADGERLAKEEALDARGKAVAAAEAERKAKVQAVNFRNKAVDALRAMTDTDVEKLIGGKPELGANEKAYLEAIAKRWQTFAKQEGTDEQSRAIQAEGHDRVANLLFKLGRKKDARPMYERGIALLEKLVADFPDVSRYHTGLAASHHNLGMLLSDLGDWPASEQRYRKAVSILTNFSADHPADSETRRLLAVNHNGLGVHLASRRKWTEAEEQYRKALAILEQLNSDAPKVSVYRRDLSSNLSNLGSLLGDTGRLAEAEERERSGLLIREELAAEFLAVPEYRENLANSYHHLSGLLRSRGKLKAAEAEYKKAVAVLEKLTTEFPAQPQYTSALANSLNSLALLLQGAGKSAEAEVRFRSALALQEKLATNFSGIPKFRRELAGTSCNLGVLLAVTGNPGRAEELFLKAQAILEKLTADFPADLDCRMTLGGNFLNLGNLRADDRPGESLVLDGKAIDILRPIFEAEPQDAKAWHLLMGSYKGCAGAYQRLGRHADEVTLWESVLKLCPQEKRLGVRANRATAQANAGLVVEAVAEVTELTKTSYWSAAEWYNFACVYAIASSKVADKKVEYADAAMKMLQQAVKAGHKDHAHMRKDTDLEPLREREDFKKLLADLEAKSPPPKPKELAPLPKAVK